jgi:D-alanyl-D-alanine carboxypeptidase
VAVTDNGVGWAAACRLDRLVPAPEGGCYGSIRQLAGWWRSLPGGLPGAVGAGPSGVWATGRGGPIWRVDPTSTRVVPPSPCQAVLAACPPARPAGLVGRVLVSTDGVWVADPAGSAVLRVDLDATSLGAGRWPMAPAMRRRLERSGGRWRPQGLSSRQDRRLVSIFERWGFTWGGRWLVPDGMHFELLSLRSAPTP